LQGVAALVFDRVVSGRSLPDVTVPNVSGPDVRALDVSVPATPVPDNPTPVDAGSVQRRRSSMTSDWPSSVTKGLEALIFEEHARAQLRHSFASQVCDALAQHKIPSLVLKGTALAKLVYAEPWHRPSADVDLLIEREALADARSVLRSMRLVPDVYSQQSTTAMQETWRGPDESAFSIELDLHWEISNVRAFSRAMQPRALLANAQWLPGRDGRAGFWTLSNEDLLLHACLHRIAHHHSPIHHHEQEHVGDRLIWLEDIRRLGKVLTQPQWERLGDNARPAFIKPLIHDALRAVEQTLGMRWPNDVTAQFQVDSPDRIANLLLIPTAWSQPLADVLCIEGWRAKMAFVLAQGLPPAQYMREHYAPGDSRPLPMLHAARLLRGLGERFRRHSTRR
jgi:hypothetical protein